MHSTRKQINYFVRRNTVVKYTSAQGRGLTMSDFIKFQRQLILYSSARCLPYMYCFCKIIVSLCEFLNATLKKGKKAMQVEKHRNSRVDLYWIRFYFNPCASYDVPIQLHFRFIFIIHPYALKKLRLLN